MVCARGFQIAAFLAFVHIVASLLENKTVQDVNNKLNLKQIDTRRHNKKQRSTSSSSGEKAKSSDSGTDESLGMSGSSSSSTSSDDDTNKKYRPKSSKERKGWRKWHRKCTPCPNDMMKKWRDRSIKWICGGYQRARRSFKSECMMYYRNCQDGTMFVKIHDHRCANDTNMEKPRGFHFFYDYGVDSQRTKSSEGDMDDSSSVHISSDSNF